MAKKVADDVLEGDMEAVEMDELSKETSDTVEEGTIGTEEDATTADLKATMEGLESSFETLFKQRTEGFYKVEIKDLENLGALRKYLKDKITWTGNESIGYVNAVTKIEEMIEDSKIDDNGNIEFQAYVLEAVNFFLNKYEGSGYHTAKNFVRVALPIQQAVIVMRQDDDTLKEIREQMADIGARISISGPSLDETETA